MDGFSFQPPAVDASAARYPTSVLLDKKAHFTDHESENATAAEAKTSTGHTVRVRVTFHLACPPAVSYFCVHGPELEREDFKGMPEVISSEKDLVLLRFALTFGPRIRSSTRGWLVLDEYFIFKAGHGKPSLKLIPVFWTVHNQSICILPCDGDDGEFILTALVSTYSIMEKDLYIFSSKTGEWSTCRRLELKISPEISSNDVPMPIDTAITLGGGEVGCVDLWQGIQVRNVLDEDPVLCFIPLPKAEFDQGQNGDSRLIRDVAFCDGFIKFVEIGRCFRQVLGVNNDKKSCKKMTNDLDNTDIIYDSEILIRNYARVEPIPAPDSWKIRTCYRHTSWDYWRNA